MIAGAALLLRTGTADARCRSSVRGRRDGTGKESRYRTLYGPDVGPDYGDFFTSDWDTTYHIIHIRFDLLHQRRTDHNGVPSTEIVHSELVRCAMTVAYSVTNFRKLPCGAQPFTASRSRAPAGPQSPVLGRIGLKRSRQRRPGDAGCCCRRPSRNSGTHASQDGRRGWAGGR